jgi:ABC-type multidrug transport system ATPase subunit
VIIVSRGKIVADGAPDDLASRSGKASYTLVLDEQARAKGEGELPLREVLEGLKALAPDAELRELPSDERAHVVQLTVPDGKDLRRELFSPGRPGGGAATRALLESLLAVVDPLE